MPMQLRSEARPVSKWTILDTQQQQALRQIVHMLKEAILNLPDRSQHQEREARLDPASWVRPDRSSQSVFLSGARGTGKTTVMLSLRKMTTDARVVVPEDLKDDIELIRRHAVWLDILDIEPMPVSANILAAILVRIEEATRRSGHHGGGRERGVERREETRGLLDLRPEYQTPLLDFQRFQARIAMAWEGNLAARSGQLDPEAFAVEVIHAERARLNMPETLERLLNALAASSFHDLAPHGPLFILPVDDFDLNPSRCLELLRLLRMVSATPRLFALVLGNIQVADVALRLQFSHDFAQMTTGSGDTALLALPPTEIAAQAREIAANALRKLIPPGQIEQLELMTLIEAYNFRPLGVTDETPRLQALLAQCPKPPAVHDMSITTLRDFLLMPQMYVLEPPTPPFRLTVGTKVTKEELEHAQYNGHACFVMTPRHLTDLWMGLEKLIMTAPQKTVLWADLTQFFARHGAQVLREERAFSPTEERLQASVTLRSDTIATELEFNPSLVKATELEFNPSLVKVSWPDDNFETTIEVPQLGDDSVDFSQHVQLRRARGWFAETASDHETGRILSPGTTSTLMLLHDLEALGPHSEHFISPWLHPEHYNVRLALTLWRGQQGQVEIPWPTPPYTSFWEWDLFLSAWQDALDKLSAFNAESLLTLGFAWIAARTAVLDGQPPVTLVHPTPTSEDLQRLSSRLESMLSVPNAKPLSARKIRQWLVRLAVLLAPESGLPAQLSDVFAGATTLHRFWAQQSAAIMLQREARLVQVDQQIPTLTEKLCVPLWGAQGEWSQPNLTRIRALSGRMLVPSRPLSRAGALLERLREISPSTPARW